MDGYLSKPLHGPDILEAIAKLFPEGPACKSGRSHAEEAYHPPALGEGVHQEPFQKGDSPPQNHGDSPLFEMVSQVLDRAELQARVGGDATALKEIIGLFLAESPQLMANIRGALEGRDLRALERAAHSLKGTAQSLAAQETAVVAQHLERVTREGDWGRATKIALELEEKMERLETVLGRELMS